MVQELLENRHFGIAQICVEYAIDLADDIPNDERWNAVGRSSHCKFHFIYFFVICFVSKFLDGS